MRLSKHSPIYVDPEAPFSQDKLKRQPSAELLADLIARVSDPFVLSIGAPFGSGKTTFVLMLQALLKSRGHPCIYFSAWENDFAESPLVAFLGELESQLG